MFMAVTVIILWSTLDLAPLIKLNKCFTCQQSLNKVVKKEKNSSVMTFQRTNLLG